MSDTFSERYNILFEAKEIVIRYERPEGLGNYLSMLLLDFFPMKDARDLVCRCVKCAPNPNNWSENDYMKEEIRNLLDTCQWNRLYDIIEMFYSKIYDGNRKAKFEKEINGYFIENGIGWILANGIITHRGDDMMEDSVNTATTILCDNGFSASQFEIKNARIDLSKRPDPDITGSIRHSISALEAVAKQLAKSHGYSKAGNDTLGEVVKHLNLTSPLDKAIHKLYGFTCNYARHGSEDRIPSFHEAELILHISASIITYLIKNEDVGEV